MRKSMLMDGKKYMWDGVEYRDESEANGAVENYAAAGFETRRIRENGRDYLFTRRVVTEIKVEGAPS